MNLEWIVLSCGFSFAARFDVLAATPRISHLTQNLRRNLDIRHSLRQVILRLDSITSPETDSDGDRDAFYHFLRRGKQIQEWHNHQVGPSPQSTPTTIDVTSTDSGHMTPGMGDFASVADASDSAAVSGGSGPGEDHDFPVVDFTEDMQGIDFGLYLTSTNFDLV